jgi:3D (Asp-Asp-Asp) domain-containing protein
MYVTMAPGAGGMRRKIERSIGVVAMAVALGACGGSAGGRGGDGPERGQWDGSGKFDETATCAGACGEITDAGCWCDETCASFGDCCPDKVSECGGAGPSDGGGEPGELLGEFELRYWFLADETRYTAPHDTTIFDPQCDLIGDVPAQLVDAIAREGMGRLEDGRVVEFFGECECAFSPCFLALDDAHPWGSGLDDRSLSPFRSVAVDPAVIALGSALYIEALDGVTMPGDDPWGGFQHDGCVFADDAANAFDGQTVGLFTALVAHYIALDKELPDAIDVRAGGSRCGGSAEGDTGEDDTGDAPIDPEPEPLPEPQSGDLCFSGPTGAGDACVSLVPASEAGYDYPPPLGGNANYRAPIAFIDLEAVPEGFPVSPSFVMAELAQKHKGRYAVVQPHAVAKLQLLRDMLGPITVNSGYRPPSYNEMVGGAEYSRHMYGDAFDMAPIEASLAELEDGCVAVGGKLVEYGSHVHCDFRFGNVDPLLFGAAAPGAAPAPLPADEYDAEIVADGDVLSIVAEGFDEGEPRVRWTALDERGEPLASAVAPSFLPPRGTAEVHAIVGGQVTATWSPD